MARYTQWLWFMYAQRSFDAKILARPSTLDRLLEACERHLSVIERLAERRQGSKCVVCEKHVGSRPHTHR